jgi:hypothetical protein
MAQQAIVWRHRNGQISYLMNSELWSNDHDDAVVLDENDAWDIARDLTASDERGRYTYSIKRVS